MGPLLPAALLPVAGALALVMAWPRLRRQRSTVRLALETAGLALVAVGVVWLGWLALWLIEQRW